MKIYDISREISPTMTFYSPDDTITVNEVAKLKSGDVCNLTRYEFSGHIGTHIDTPLHFLDGGATCDNIDLSYFYGQAKLVQSLEGNGRDVSKADLLNLDIDQGDILLINTGNRALTADAATYLAELKIKTIGIDSLSADVYGSQSFEVHHTLLGAGIAIIEGLQLDGVPQGRYDLSALPLKFKNGNGSPVRAILADKSKVELVIFDMDGLMIDSEPMSKESWRLALELSGYPMEEDFFGKLLGRNIVTARELMNSHYGADFDFEKVRQLRNKKVKELIDANGLQLKKGLPQMLDILDKLQIKKCVATSTEWEGMEWKLKMVGIFDRFDNIITGDQVKVGKPNPEIFLKAAKQMGVVPANCIVLEDSDAGVEAGYSAGMRTIVIPDMAKPSAATLSRVYAECENLLEAAEIVC